MSTAKQKPRPKKRPQWQGSGRCGSLQLCCAVSSALCELTSLLFLPAQVLVRLKASNERIEGTDGRRSGAKYEAYSAYCPSLDCLGLVSYPQSRSHAGTSLVADLKHISVTLATWDAVWDVYMDPKWAWQRLRPRSTDQLRGRVVLVDEHRISRGSSAVNGQQPCESRPSKRRATRPADWKPPAGQMEHRLLRPAWSQQRDQPVRGLMWSPAPCSSQAATQPAASEPGPITPLPAKRSKRVKAKQAAEITQPTKGKGKGKAAQPTSPGPRPGRWVDRDRNAMLNMQRIGESRWRPLELCWWPEQGKLPAKGKEYSGLGYKRLRDRPPQAQQQQPAAAQ
ncbi:hypothetical protein QJQ45_004196 [Haematococcus lacustris]|nr:hypothetical protein QJQ45_004196 [Haematococcus lacustris]